MRWFGIRAEFLVNPLAHQRLGLFFPLGILAELGAASTKRNSVKVLRFLDSMTKIKYGGLWTRQHRTKGCFFIIQDLANKSRSYRRLNA